MEREQFLQNAVAAGGKTATFCAVLALTGGRISEVLAVTPDQIDLANSTISFETLKRRKRGIFRVVPVSNELIYLLDAVHHLGVAQNDSKKASERLWPWSRSTAWRRVKVVMKLAMVPAFVSQPKALRHALGVDAAMKGVVITLIKEILGHADVRTTLTYTRVVGSEARAMLERTWPQSVDLRFPCRTDLNEPN
jgi:integrase